MTKFMTVTIYCREEEVKEAGLTINSSLYSWLENIEENQIEAVDWEFNTIETDIYDA